MITIAAIGCQSWLYMDFTDFFDQDSSNSLPHFECASKAVYSQTLVAYSYIFVETYPLFPNMMHFWSFINYSSGNLVIKT